MTENIRLETGNIFPVWADFLAKLDSFCEIIYIFFWILIKISVQLDSSAASYKINARPCEPKKSSINTSVSQKEINIKYRRYLSEKCWKVILAGFGPTNEWHFGQRKLAWSVHLIVDELNN